MIRRPACRSFAVLAALALAACGGGSSSTPDGGSGPGPDGSAPSPDATPAPDAGPGQPWSRNPPGTRPAAEVPQLVDISFDDNFGLADPVSTGGVNYIVDFFKNKKNPAGAGNAHDFDGAPAHVSFYFTTIYVVDDSKTVLGGKSGEDHMGRNRAAWSAAFADGHEVADHTVNHFNGGVVPLDPDDCCKARNWGVADWAAEMQQAKDHLTDPQAGIGATAADVIGFRTPFLGYNDHTFSALSQLGFVYDTTLPNCFADEEDGSNCSWPYTLDEGSPDLDTIRVKFPPSSDTPVTFPAITKHAGLWELPPTTLIIPPDSVAEQYHFTPGLRARVNALGELPYPSITEASTGKIAGLDYTLLMDAHVTGDEMRAILEYNLDLHIAGNRAPFVFIGHSHLYAFSTADDNPDTPTAEARDARWKGLTDFLTYAMSKPEVRLVSEREVVDWMRAEASGGGR
jgi:peptidoglycan/xylan/chitin deacetylase (PgdA/CDA1 family)